MEEKFFDWMDYDPVDDLIVQYFDCTIKVDIGRFRVGDKLEVITIDYEHGVMELYYKGELASTHQLEMIFN